jgi:hypothetical protein
MPTLGAANSGTHTATSRLHRWHARGSTRNSIWMTPTWPRRIASGGRASMRGPPRHTRDLRLGSRLRCGVGPVRTGWRGRGDHRVR